MHVAGIAALANGAPMIKATHTRKGIELARLLNPFPNRRHDGNTWGIDGDFGVGALS